jgi:small neutral amino acid transporter SnatA (MarC family)
MLKSFITAFIIYFVVIDLLGNAPLYIAITAHLPKRQKYALPLMAVSWRRR